MRAGSVEAPVCAGQTGAVHVGGSLRNMDCGGMLRRAPQRDMGRSLPPWPPAGADAIVRAPTNRTLRRQCEARELRRACCVGALGRSARSPGGEVSDKKGSGQRGRPVSRNADASRTGEQRSEAKAGRARGYCRCLGRAKPRGLGRCRGRVAKHAPELALTLRRQSETRALRREGTRARWAVPRGAWRRSVRRTSA